jgi:hypothetical protein
MGYWVAKNGKMHVGGTNHAAELRERACGHRYFSSGSDERRVLNVTDSRIVLDWPYSARNPKMAVTQRMRDSGCHCRTADRIRRAFHP